MSGVLFEAKIQYRFYSRCSAPQCNVNLHFTKERNCFREWHSAEFHRKYLYFLFLVLSLVALFHNIMCWSIIFFGDVSLLFTNSMFAAYCSSVNYAIAVSSLPYLLELFIFTEIFRILWKHLWLYYWYTKHSSDSFEQLLGTSFLLFLEKIIQWRHLDHHF